MPWFWQAVLFLIFVVPVFVLFGYAVWDVFRRHDTGGGHKALWLIAFYFVPIIGPLVYLVIRQPGTTERQRRVAEGQESEKHHLTELADLHDRGKLTDQEYAHAKAQQLGVPGDAALGDVTLGSVREQRGGGLL